MRSRRDLSRWLPLLVAASAAIFLFSTLSLPPEVIADAGTDVVLCNFLMPHALMLFDQFGIKAYVGASGTVEDALKAYEEGRLSEPDGSNMGPEGCCPGA